MTFSEIARLIGVDSPASCSPLLAKDRATIGPENITDVT